MNKKTVLVPEGTFRSRLIPVAAVLGALSAVTGLLSLLSLMIPGAVNLLDAASTDPSAKLTWTVLYILFVIFAAMCGMFLSLSLTRMQRGDFNQGADLICRGAKIGFYAVTGIGIAAAALFVIRLVLFLVAYLPAGGGAGAVYAFPILLAELLLAVIAGLIVWLLRGFMDMAGGGAVSIAYILTSGTLKSPSISIKNAVGCLALGLAGAYMFVNRVTTVSAWAEQEISGLAMVPLYLSAAAFLASGAAGIMMFFYLRSFKRISEYLLYKGTPVEEQA